MSFRNFLEAAIVSEANKLIRRDQRYAKEVHDQLHRIKRRSGVRHKKILLRPDYWKLDSGFDPYHVRSKAAAYAFAVDKQLRSGTYRPRPAVIYTIPKSDGSLREISVFQVADSALSRMVYKDLIGKNAARFSSRCYAYRTDVTLHDAVQHIATQFRRDTRLFVAEFDYRAFFDTLDHAFLERLLDEQRFLITRREKNIVRAFLKTPALQSNSYLLNYKLRESGIPQGTSISLFLANAAGSFLDEQLEQLGVGFARYADDTLVWSSSYETLLRAADTLSEIGRELGVRLNMQKSEGISILEREGESSEFKSKESVKFIGYSISRTNIRMASGNAEKAKSRISQIVYQNLLKPVSDGNLRPERLADFDLDYYVMILQIRRYLYGGLSEAKLRSYASKAAARIHFKGLMSFYPIVDDELQLRQLDGWMLHSVFTTLRLRRRYILDQGLNPGPPINCQNKEELLDLKAVRKGKEVDLRLPSFVRMSSLVRRMAKLFGVNQVANSRPTPYYEE